MSGAETGPGGRPPIWAGMAVAAMLLAKALVDAQSLAAINPALPAWQPHVLEFSSGLFFAAMLWPIWQVSRRLRPPQLGWLAGLAAHLALSVPFVLAHALWLAGSRSALFALAGASYHFDWSWAQLVFEWRKDVVTLLALCGLGLVLDRLFDRPAGGGAQAPAATPAQPWRLAVKDGGRTRFLAPDEISHASTAGNYVELATGHGPVLHRTTMAALADELAVHGFVRIHRAHLVRAAAVTSVATEGSGDFSVMLANGTSLPGSRRYRQGLDALGA
jgi:hypothetical protein